MNIETLDREYKQGDKGGKVIMVQEWLTLNKYAVAIDGDFGPATVSALRKFKASAGLTATGVADAATFEALTAPMRRALAPIPASGKTLNDLIVAYAQQHLAEHPLEVGGENCGPWVRLYTGHEGKEWAWCAGFAGFILKQACDTFGVPLPLTLSLSCTELAHDAIKRGSLIMGKPLAPILPGSLFLNRGAPGAWEHTGIVIAFHDDSIETIEGNTNDVGSREGYEVCRRVRGYNNKDFIKIG